MAFLIGTDEAGYGPNLGPLVVTATVWQLPDELLYGDLYPAVARVIRAAPSAGPGDHRVAIADSKKLYSSGASLANLERGVLSVLGAIHRPVDSWQRIWRALDESALLEFNDVPWYSDYDTSIPCSISRDEVAALTKQMADGFEQSGVACRSIRSRAVFPRQFNELIAAHGNKATALSHVTLSIVKSLVETIGDQAILVHCDKLGGRNHYAAMLQHFFPEHLVEVCRESRAESVYRWGPAQRRVEIRFVAKGESCLASALASMTSKYLRELAMSAFNEFWQRHLPGIRPTAGYPVDARRFRAEIADVQRKLEIPDQILWRCR